MISRAAGTMIGTRIDIRIIPGITFKISYIDHAAAEMPNKGIILR